MHFIRNFILILLCGFFLSSPLALAEETATPTPTPPPAPQFETAFQEGITAYQKKDYAAAQTAFSQALAARTDEPATLTNLGFTYDRLGQKGLALAYLRKVLALKPGQSEAQKAVNFILKQEPLREIPHQIETFESLHVWLFPYSLITLAFLTLLIFFVTAWSWLSYVGLRKRAFKNETVLPSLPLLPFLFSFFLAASGFLVLAKWKDSLDTRATIIVPTIAALTAPTDKAPSLFDLFEGMEVVVREQNGDWIQVTYPGALTGWVPRASLFVTQSGGH